MTLSDLFKEITSALESKNIPYMISGSMAMLAYSVSRTTRDIDVVIELSEESLEEFIAIFGDHFYINRATVKEELTRLGMFNVIDHRSGLKIDFIVKKNSPYRNVEFERRTRQSLLGHEAWVVSLEDLILSKLIWIQQIQSDRQQEDIMNLLENPVTDKAYLKKWINELGLTTFGLL